MAPTNDWWPNLGIWQHKNADRVEHTVAPPEGQWGHEHQLWAASQEFEKYVAWDELVPNVIMRSNEVREYAEIKSTITTFVDESIVAFVTGRKDISSDSDWNAYLGELDNIGLPRMLELYQAAIR